MVLARAFQSRRKNVFQESNCRGMKDANAQTSASRDGQLAEFDVHLDGITDDRIQTCWVMESTK